MSDPVKFAYSGATDPECQEKGCPDDCGGGWQSGYGCGGCCGCLGGCRIAYCAEQEEHARRAEQ